MKIKYFQSSKHTPWNIIAKKYHVSTKTISSIRNKQQGTKNYGDELAAKVFELFEKGNSPIDAVIKLNVNPKIVSEFFEEWKDMTEHKNISCNKCAKRALEIYKEKYVKGVIFYPCSKCGDDMIWRLDNEEKKNRSTKSWRKEEFQKSGIMKIAGNPE